MTSNSIKVAATVSHVTSVRNVIHGETIRPPLNVEQARLAFLQRRFRLPPQVASIFAETIFGEARS